MLMNAENQRHAVIGLIARIVSGTGQKSERYAPELLSDNTYNYVSQRKWHLQLDIIFFEQSAFVPFFPPSLSLSLQK